MYTSLSHPLIVASYRYRILFLSHLLLIAFSSYRILFLLHSLLIIFYYNYIS